MRYELIKKFFVTFAVSFILLTLCRLLATVEHMNWSMFHAYNATAALIFSLVGFLWKFQLRFLVLYILFIGLNLLVLFLKIKEGLNVSEREIVQTLSLATMFVSLPCLMLYFSSFLSNKGLRFVLKAMSSVLFAVLLFPSVMFIGYYVAGEGTVLSPDAFLAIFQTDIKEAIGYLSEQNLLTWFCGSLFIIISIALMIFLFLSEKVKRFDKITPFIISILLIALLPGALKKYSLCYMLNIPRGVVETLDSYKKYKENSASRIDALQKLAQEVQFNEAKGIYVLVIGESMTRDHMSCYGYPKQTTPFLDEIKDNENTILFENAWSNDVCTVPALSYALTGQNQYNKKDISEVYSLSEITRMSGFDTYWISNQTPFRSSDIPIVTFANTMAHRNFINQHAGSGTFSSFYDEKIVDTLPDLKSDEAAFIVVHLMGSHAVYKERYPKQFEHFTQGDMKVCNYDNSVLYTDYVLSKLYQKLKMMPNFMGLIYMSDHGEEPDLHLAHDGAKFTCQMSKIPLVMLFSDAFKKEKEHIFNTLKLHQKEHWTNDLLYDMMMSILGVQNVPDADEQYDIASEKYHLPVEKLLTYHGKKKISECIR